MQLLFKRLTAMKTNYQIEVTVNEDMGTWIVKIGTWSKTVYCKDDVNYYLDQFKNQININ